jgi:hypothetical protein
LSGQIEPPAVPSEDDAILSLEPSKDRLSDHSGVARHINPLSGKLEQHRPWRLFIRRKINCVRHSESHSVTLTHGSSRALLHG